MVTSVISSIKYIYLDDFLALYIYMYVYIYTHTYIYTFRYVLLCFKINFWSKLKPEMHEITTKMVLISSCQKANSYNLVHSKSCNPHNTPYSGTQKVTQFNIGSQVPCERFHSNNWIYC